MQPTIAPIHMIKITHLVATTPCHTQFGDGYANRAMSHPSVETINACMASSFIIIGGILTSCQFQIINPWPTFMKINQQLQSFIKMSTQCNVVESSLMSRSDQCTSGNTISMNFRIFHLCREMHTLGMPMNSNTKTKREPIWKPSTKARIDTPHWWQRWSRSCAQTLQHQRFCFASRTLPPLQPISSISSSIKFLNDPRTRTASDKVPTRSNTIWMTESHIDANTNILSCQHSRILAVPYATPDQNRA